MFLGRKEIDYSSKWRGYFTLPLRENCPNTGGFSGPYSALFELNTENYGVNLRIQSEYKKIQTRKTLYLDIFHAVFIEPRSNSH